MNMLLYQILDSIHGKMLKPVKNNNFKILVPMWKDKFKLPDESFSVLDIKGCFEYIIKKHGEETDNPPIKMYVKKIENMITFKIKKGYYLEPFMPETIKLLESTRNKITKDEDGKNKPQLEMN